MRVLAVGLGLFTLSCHEVCGTHEQGTEDLRGIAIDGTYGSHPTPPDGGFPAGALAERTLTIRDGRAVMVLATDTERYEIEFEVVKANRVYEVGMRY